VGSDGGYGSRSLPKSKRKNQKTKKELRSLRRSSKAVEKVNEVPGSIRFRSLLDSDAFMVKMTFSTAR
jgi:hypothetical protein